MSPITTVCPHCGVSVTAGVKFCGECGQAIPAIPTCSNCGAVISATTKFCGECGQSIEGRVAESPPGATEPVAGGVASQQMAGLSPKVISTRKPKIGPTAPPAQPIRVPALGTTASPQAAAGYVAPAPASAQPVAAPTAKGRPSPLILIGGAAIVVCVLAAIVFLMTGGPGKQGVSSVLTKSQASSAKVGSVPTSASGSAAGPAAQAAATPPRAATAGTASADPAAAGSDAGPHEYVIEVKGEGKEVGVSVASGSVTVADAAGAETAVGKGQQVQLPSGKIAAYNAASDDGGATGGIPLRKLLVDNDLPAAYDIYEPTFLDDQIPSDWVLEDPKQDTLVKTPDPFSVVLTVPDGNDLWGDRADAPRLLHRVTGDFDLQGEILLQTKATDLAYVQFVVKAPGTMIGALKDQMAGGTGTADYLLLPSSWYAAGGQNRIGCLIWEKRMCPEGPADFLHVRLTRRGDVFTTYTSLDGKRWNLHSQQTLLLPDTLWTGWLAKRMANDGMPKEPAVVTLRNIRLDTRPRHWMPWSEWDFDQLDGRAEAQDNRVTLTLDGTKLGQVYAMQGEPIEGDFDVIAAYQTNAWNGEAGKRPGLGLTIADLDRSKGSEIYQRRVYVNALQAEDGKTPPFIGTDLKIENRWQQYDKAKFTPGNQGKFRIIRQGATMSTYALDGTKWVRLDRFDGRGFSEPATIWLYIWNSEVKVAAAFSATFTLEQIATGDRVTETVKSLTGIVAGAPTAIPPAAAPATTSGVLFDDNFASKQASEVKGWTFRTDDQVDTTWSSNQLVTSVKADSGLLWGFTNGDYDDAGVEAEAQFVGGEGASFSLVLRHSEAGGKGGYYEFGITSTGRYYLLAMADNRGETIAGPRVSSLIKPAPERNTLGMLVTGSSLSLYINRTLVETVTDTRVRGKGKAGFSAFLDAPPAGVALSRFTIYTPDQARKSWSAAAAPVTGATTGDAAAVDREKMALAAPPGYKRFVTTYADFSVNIPDSWQSLAEEAKGRQIVLGSMGSKTNLEIRISAAGENLDQVINNWIQTMKGQVVMPAARTAVGHYEARQAVVDVSETARRFYLAAVSAPNNTFLLALGGPVSDPNTSVLFAAAVASFRVPARCGVAVCPELLQRDAVVGTPVPAQPAPSKAATGPVYSAVTFSSEFDQDKVAPVNPAKTFPYGVKIVYAYWTYSNGVPDTEYVYDWYRDDTRVDGSAEYFTGASSKAFQWLIYGATPTTPLDPGNYRFVVRVGNQQILADTFVIQR